MLFVTELSGRSLSNSVINLGIRDQYADALSQLGFEFEVLAEQVSIHLFLLLMSFPHYDLLYIPCTPWNIYLI